MFSKYLLLTIAIWLMTTLALGQDIYYPSEKVDLGFDPNSAVEKMDRARAAALQHQGDVEPDRIADNNTNWQEYDITYYDCYWYPDFATEALSGRVGIHGLVTVPELDSVIVNLTDGATVDSVYNTTGVLSYTHTNHHLTVYLDRIYESGKLFDFTVVYSVPEQGYWGMMFYTRDGYPEASVFTEPYYSREWWPCNDIPMDKADSVDVHVTTDTALAITGNGLLMADIDNGDGTHTAHWSERYPISTYLVAIAVGRFIRWEDQYISPFGNTIPIVNYLQPDEYDISIITLAVTNDAMEIFENLFGPYPFADEKYGITQVTGGGMEYQTNTALDPDYSKRDEVIVHELAHSWWGDMITCRTWSNVWLNEGFATYCEALFFEATKGIGFYHAYMLEKEWFTYGSVYQYDTTNVLSSIVYRKGAWVLHMLRHLIGDEDFFPILQQYGATYAYESAVTDEFIAVCEEVTGQDLDWFFQQWVYGFAHPTYQYSAVIRRPPVGTGWNTYIYLEQIQATNPQVFVTSIDIQFWIDSNYAVQEVQNDQRRQLYMFHTLYHPDAIGLDPHNWVLDEHSESAYTLHIFTDELPDGVQGAGYDDTIVIIAANEAFTAEIVSGDLPTGWELDPASGIIFGSTWETGEFTFTVLATDALEPGYVDSKEYTISVTDMGYSPGDANLDGSVDIGDAVYLINYIFKGGPAPEVPNWADVNADCAVNVGDAVYLVNYVFNSGPEPQPGCVE